MRTEILSIDQAVKRRYLTKQEGIEHHSWQKNVCCPVDTKLFVYVDGSFIGIANSKLEAKLILRP